MRTPQPNSSNRMVAAPSNQPLTDSITGKEINAPNAAHPDEGTEPAACVTTMEPGDVEIPAVQEQAGSTVLERDTTEHTGSIPACTTQVTTEASSDSQKSQSIPDGVTELPVGPHHSAAVTETSHDSPLALAGSIDVSLDKQSIEEIGPALDTRSSSSTCCETFEGRSDANPGVLADDGKVRSGDMKAGDPPRDQPPSHLKSGMPSSPSSVLRVSNRPKDFILSITWSLTRPTGTENLLSKAVKTSVSGTYHQGQGSMLTQVGSAIVISDDETEQMRKSPRSCGRKVSKRSIQQYIESENLWMSSTLVNLDDVLNSTRKHIKSLKAMEEQLIAAQEFIRDCGAKENRFTKRLEKVG